MPDCGAMALSIDSTGVGEHGGAQGHSGLLQYNVTASGHLAEDTYAFYQVRPCHDLNLTTKLTPPPSLAQVCVARHARNQVLTIDLDATQGDADL